MTDLEHSAMLDNALDRLTDMADPMARGEPITMDDQAAIRAVLTDYERLRTKGEASEQ